LIHVMPQNKHANNGCQIGRLLIGVDGSYQVRQAFLSNVSQGAPEIILKAYAGPVAINDGRAFEN